VMKSNDHKGCKCHGLIISHQPPLVRREEDVSQEQGGADIVLPGSPCPASSIPAPACPCG
jgi:hypothetical protein